MRASFTSGCFFNEVSDVLADKLVETLSSQLGPVFAARPSPSLFESLELLSSRQDEIRLLKPTICVGASSLATSEINVAV